MAITDSVSKVLSIPLDLANEQLQVRPDADGNRPVLLPRALLLTQAVVSVFIALKAIFIICALETAYAAYNNDDSKEWKALAKAGGTNFMHHCYLGGASLVAALLPQRVAACILDQ